MNTNAALAMEELAENKAQRVYRELRDAIMNGSYSPGYRLVLSRLAEEFDVSPVPVREAVRRLEAQGLVTHTRNVGFEVSGIDPADYSEGMETLAVMEGAATALASPHMTAPILAQARELNERMRELVDDPSPLLFTELNSEFHLLLTSTCPNQHLVELLHREWVHLGRVRRSTFSYVPGRIVQSVQEHDGIIDLIESGADQATVEQAVRSHTLRTRDMFMHEAVPPAPRV